MKSPKPHGQVGVLYPGDGQKFYKVDGRLLPSAGQLVHLLTQQSFDHIALDTLERARMEGEGAHQVACSVSLSLMTGDALSPGAIPPCPAEYAQKWGAETWRTVMIQTTQDVMAFFKDYHVEPIAVEQPAVSLIYSFGGQPDLLCRLLWKRKTIEAVVDYKRVAGLDWGMRLKIMCYRMLEGFQDCKAGFLLHFKKAGGYELVEVKDDAGDKAGLMGAAAVLRCRGNHE